jgi:hypothetical protein
VVTIAPREPAVLAPPPGADRLDSALATIARAANRLQLLIVPPIDAPGADPRRSLEPLIQQLLRPVILPGVDADGSLGVEAVVRAYHRELSRAFAMAATGSAVPVGTTTPLGELIAERARVVLLDHVLFPHNRLLGRRKAATALAALNSYARGGFARVLASEVKLPPDREAATLYVFQQLLSAIETVHDQALRDWRGDSRVIWLPLQLGLLPDQHDTQTELDALVARAVGQPFTDGNRVWYVINEQFQREVTQSILLARDYHVLWIHDFRGRNSQGQPDALSLRYVVNAYLRAMTERVRAYDGSGRLPVYMILLDQHYYEANRGRLWMDFLERPLGGVPTLPEGFTDFEQAIRAAQAELRAAVDSSRLLQAESRQYGARWLANLLKVHVNITNPVDPSFWGKDVMPVIGLPDAVMRDHRKIAFYDITEEDPYRGLAIYTGMGIGEHYTGPTWEDRAIMAQGPAVLTLKTQARNLLLSQGLQEDEIPAPLRARPKAASYDSVVRARTAAFDTQGALTQRAMELHNGTGYLDKPINAAKATLYTLMPPGSVVKVPDSLWGSAIYASLLTGSAFRGVRVLFIAPSLASAPSSGWPAMGIAHDLFGRLIVIQNRLRPELEAGGGMLKTGIYNPGLGTQETLRRFRAAYDNARRTPFLRRLFPINPTVDSMLVQLSGASESPAPEDVEAPVVPKLHLKANFFASREAWDSLVTRPEMRDIVLAYVQQLVASHDSGGADIKQAAEALSGASRQLVDSFRSRLSVAERERVIYYLIVGSPNQDYRSMFMDGEAAVLLSGWSSVQSLIDFGLLVSLSVWVDDLSILDGLLPPPSGLQRSLAYWIRSLL